ncbi:MAG: hypothetical protein ACN6OP_13190 [Pseudomonadales bacterium]
MLGYDLRMSRLRLVPPTEPSAAEQVRHRVRRMARPDGTLQCNRCGSRTAVTVVTGAAVKNGRVQGGTVLARYECAECWKRGIYSTMLPELKPVK